MLQPREQTILRSLFTILCILLACIQNGFAQYSDDVYIVEPTPALRLTNQGDLTTVLLLNNNNRGTHGRYLNVKPTVGLLTSTARTFIQEGVTTEYATQVLGTTLDNGRLYAQLLKKSSRVLYDKESSPTVISPTGKFPGTVQTLQTFSPNPKSLLQSHNDIIGDQDWQLIDDHLLSVNNNNNKQNSYNNLNTFVRNTDFVSPNDSPQRYSALLVFPTQSYNNVAVAGASHENFAVAENFPNQTFSVSHSSSSSSSSSGRNNIAAQKVLHAGDLPTFTIKNMFAPSGFSWDSPIDDDFVVDQQTERISKVRTEQLRAPKLLQQHNNRILNNELRNLPTVTYYGFAEFTTIVGDTVIVFSPSTSASSGNQGQVTSIKGEATLNNSPLETAFTHQLIEPTFTVQHTAATVDPYTPPPPTSPETPTIHQHDESDEADDDDDQDQFDLTMPEDSDDDNSDDGNSDEEYSTTTEQESVGEDTTSKIDEINETTKELATIVANQIDLEPSIVGVGERQTTVASIDATATSTSTLLSKPSNEDISKIFASLASAEAAKKLAAQSSEAVHLQQETGETIATTPTTSTIENPIVRVDAKSSERTAKDIESIGETTTIPPSTENNLIAQISSEKQDESSTSPTNEIVDKSAEKPQEKPQQIDAVIESSIEPETKISGGVTTIFFEDDPFQAFEATPTQQLIVPTVTTTTPEAVTEAITTDDNNDNDNDSEITTTEPDANVTESNVDESIDESCEHRTSEITSSIVPKTLTYLTTFFISDADQTSTSIESNVVVTYDVSSSTKFSCADEIEATPLVKEPMITMATSEADSIKNTIEEPTTGEEPEVVSTTPEIVDEVVTTTPRMIVTEKAHVTTEESTVTEANSTEKEISSTTTGEDYEDDVGDDDDDSQQSDEEIELIYKTLYTTYTYLTTFFHESTTSVSSRTEILTNVISSTVDPSLVRSDLGVTQLLSSISPTATLDQGQDATSIGVGRPTTGFQVQQSDLVQIDGILREDEEHVTPTVSLDDQQVQTNGVKTYYTTYTYFTTIFVDGETEITSRTEIYTNFVTGGGGSSTRSTVLEEDKLEYTVRDDDNNVLVDITPTSVYEAIQKTSVVQENAMDSSMIAGAVHVGVEGASVVESSFVSSSSSSNADENQITMVTDVRSSSSDGDRHIIENINKQWNGFFEDQISSESNTDEILPSSTLLLQTSYTTFTYFTTMYIGNTASNILSRLETVTNVVTETLQPTQTINADDSSLPITYFTTFTYWTTLYKDGEITTISREETVSNVVTPTTSLESIVATEVIQPSTTVESRVVDESAIVSISEIGETESVGVVQSIVNSTTEMNSVNATSSGGVTKTIEPTTYYTTYTYFTTSYVGEETVLNSRFKTVTNIVTQIPELVSIGDGQLAPTVSVINVNATPIVDETSTEPPPPTPVLDSQVIGLNEGKIVDAEGISTLYYTTKTIATRINNELTEIVESSSSLNIDEVKRALSTSEVDPASRTYKTGLVRLIDGTMVANRTTTLYQSKVIGTVIEGRYAQIIESTSSFLIEKTISPETAHVEEIAPSTTQSPTDSSSLQTAFNPTPSADVVQGSISDGTEEKDEQFEDSDDDNEEEDEDDGSVDENGRPKSRLTFQTKKRTFTPVIRPFASRNRPQFAPKRKNAAPGSATIITRSDFTPTITATPALKSDSSRGRFSSNRKSSSSVLNSSNASAVGSRKFSRSRSSSSGGGGFASSSAFPGGSSRKGVSSARIQPTSSYFGLSSRRGGASSQRSSGSNSGRSSVYAGNSRLRIKPTSTVPGADSGHLNTNVYTTQEPDAEEENATQTGTAEGDNSPAEEEDGDVEVTTESSRRQNPLLRFRRPQIAGRNLAVSQRRNPLTPRPKTTAAPTTTTTAKPRPRSFQRPPIATFQSRPRPASNLFPPRGLFRPQAINQDLDEGKKDEEDLYISPTSPIIHREKSIIHQSSQYETVSSSNSDESARFFNFQPFVFQLDTPTVVGDEARYNLATRIMSNGVEVIVAGDKSKTAAVHRHSVLRILPSNLYKPMTLAPSTLKNQMIMIAPSEENLQFPIKPNQFVTKTCLTTYTYLTTYLQDGTTTVESREKVISNIATEQQNYMKITPTSTSGVTLSRTPEFAIGVFHTTYTYLNTIVDGELPLVVSSKHIVTNTITGPEDYISFLQPSEEATPIHETNTYFSKITMTRTLHDTDIEKIVSTSNVLTQVVITESLPPKSTTSVMTSYIALDAAEDVPSNANSRLHIYATKTYLTTFTYFTTVLKSAQYQTRSSTLVKSHKRVVENVITESIPNHMLSRGALEKFRDQLRIASTALITTLATLIGGQTLEITAMNMLGTQLHQQQTQTYANDDKESVQHDHDDIVVASESETEPAFETIKDDDNAVDDSDAAGSEHNDQHFTNVLDPSEIANKTKDNDKNGFQVPNLIGSLNLNGLTALGPVINAMAGLIQTNFGSPTRKNLTRLRPYTNEISSKNLLKNISSTLPANDLSSLQQQQQHSPIYIPVRSSTNELLNGNRAPSPASLHIAPPKPQRPHQHQQKWQMHTDEKSNRNNKLEFTVGKPTYETPLLNGGIPISPGEVITANSDVIIGKQAGVRPRVPFPEQDLPPKHNSPNVIPLLPYQQNFIRPPKQPPPSPALQSSPIAASVSGYKNYHQSHSSIALPNRYQNQAPTNFIHTSPIPHSTYHQHQHQHQQHQYPRQPPPPLNNEILEIKRIPEVFSTDLPAFHVTKVHQQQQQQHRNTEKPMLVNIQPSQVANVVIPHGNTAPVLIIESTAELHKNGQYFDEPSPYPNTVIGIDSPTSQNNIIAGSDSYHGLGSSSSSSSTNSNGVGESSNHPIHINLDANVLSHNIDVHVPPITFKKENEFPHSTPIRGQHSQSVHKNGHYNVNIPYYDHEVNVNLTPQHDHHYPNQQYQVHGMEPPPINGNSGPATPTKTFIHQRPQYHYTPSGGNNNNFAFNKNYLYGPRYPQPTSQSIPLFVGDDNSPVEHSQAPSINDEITDQHHDDDYENEEGEVIQESNSLPVIPGHYIDYPTSTTSKTVSYNIPPFLNMPSASAINELHHMEMKSTTNAAWTTTSTTLQPNTKSTTPTPKSPTTNTKPYFISIGEKFRPPLLLTTRPTLRPSRLPSVPSSSGSGFRKPTDQSSPDPSTNEIINGGAIDSFHNYVQVSLPIDRPQVLNDDNTNGGHATRNITTTQTETPFNRNNYIKPPITNDLEKDSSEIFDYKESINPHNLGVINNLDDTSTTGSATLPELSVNMRPPPPPPPSPSVSVQAIAPTTEEVMGLNPPPLPSQVLFNTPLPTLNLRNPQRPAIPLRTSSMKTTTTTPRITTFSPTTLGDWTKPSTSPAPLTERTARPILRFSTRYRTPTTPMPRTKWPGSMTTTSKFNYNEKKVVTEKPGGGSSAIIPTPSIKENVTRTSPTSPTPTVLHSTSGELFNELQQIPDEILITGSEVSPTSENHSAIGSVVVGHTETVTITKPLNFSKRTRLVSKIILPTKFVTNTKTLTVTTTKTTVVESQGIPSTQTLILTITRTSTAVDTVTETEIHTLHHQLSSTTIQLSPTTRLQTPAAPSSVHHNPEKEPTPSDEVVNKITDFETTSDSAAVPSSYPIHKIPPAFYPTPAQSAGNKTAAGGQQDSIFVVMTDQKNAGSINMADTKTPTRTSLNTIGGDDDDDNDPTLDDTDYNNLPSFNLPERDEDPINGESNHVLLGGILIATPPKVSESSECRPDCKASRNELCQRLDGHMRCVCRPGFARMFPDRPCKPTYTYKLSLPLQRFGKEMLAFNENLASKESDGFYYLAGLTHEALDRMVMQSDFRDIYHGVHVAGFDRTSDGNGVVGEFYLQLSDDSDEQRLIDVFRKYLRSTNYSIGGTELYSARTGGADDLKASDFDECLNTLFHDCSESAHCFNLHGTYTCSCKEGFADLSENPVYPGRICSAEQIGCEKCYYHGTCYARELDSDSDQMLCQCFAWYAGASCQLNLKILLIALVSVGALLVLLLFFCLLVTCSKRRKARGGGVLQPPMSDINVILPKSGLGMRSGVGGRGGKATKLDKRAMIKDSSSEASHSSDTLPYVAKKNVNKDAEKKLSVVSSLQHNAAMAKLTEAEHRCNLLDQNDRSLTVMIPRAKYHPISHMENSGAQVATSCASEAKLLSYLDAGAQLSPTLQTKKLSSGSTNHNNNSSSNNKQLLASLTGGALVSAGFEVSATVGQDATATATLDTKSHLIQKLSKMHNGSSALNSDGHSQYGGYKKQSGSENNDNAGGFLDPMDAWLDTMQHTELTVSEARSFDETTIQPQTKSLRSVYEKHSQLNNDEANTMAERDIGSTFLLPHTHLYKPDRGSDDVSGFDSF